MSLAAATARARHRQRRRVSQNNNTTTTIENLPVMGPLGIMAEFLPAVERFGSVRRVSRHFRALPRAPMVFLETDAVDGVWLPVYGPFLRDQSDLTPEEWAAMENDEKQSDLVFKEWAAMENDEKYYRLRKAGTNQRFSAPTVQALIDGMNLLRGDRPHINEGVLKSAVNLEENGVQPRTAAWVERVWSTLNRHGVYSLIVLTNMLKMQALTKLLAASVALQIKRSLLPPPPPLEGAAIIVAHSG